MPPSRSRPPSCTHPAILSVCARAWDAAACVAGQRRSACDPSAGAARRARGPGEADGCGRKGTSAAGAEADGSTSAHGAWLLLAHACSWCVCVRCRSMLLGPVLQAEEMATVEGKGAGARASNSSAALPARGATSRAQAGTGAAAASLLASPSAAPSGDAACLPCGPILTPILVAAGTTRRSKPCALVDRAHMCMRARMRAQNAAPRGIRGCAPFMDALHAFARHR